MSTRENALKQQYVPLRTFQPFPLPNHAGASSTENCRELMYAASDAEDEASTPELGQISTLISRCALTSSDMIQAVQVRPAQYGAVLTSLTAVFVPEDLMT